MSSIGFGGQRSQAVLCNVTLCESNLVVEKPKKKVATQPVFQKVVCSRVLTRHVNNYFKAKYVL